MADKIAKVIAKLEDSIKAGDFYGALQMYRTVIKRKVDAKSFSEAQGLLVQGATTLNKYGKVMEAADLGDMLIKTILENQKQPLNEGAVEAIEAIARSFPRPPPAAALTFARAAARWGETAPVASASSSAGGEETDEQHDACKDRLHLLAARTLSAAGPDHRPDAQRHYLESSSPVEFASFLWSWAQDGYASETDLFLARAVLQLLCLGNIRDANAVRNEYYKLGGADAEAAAGGAGNTRLDTPLCHFLRFVLLTLERDAAPLYKTLLEKYAPSLARDPSGSLQAYCTTIGMRFYSIQPPQTGMGAMMEAMMGNMMSGGKGGGMPPGFPAGLLGAMGGPGPFPGLPRGR